MDLLAMISLAFGAAWASGINLYATVAVLGLLNVFGFVALPQSLEVISDPLVLGVAVVMYIVEFVADKIPGVDSVWDSIHTFIRVPAGALLAAGTIADVSEPYQIAAVLLGGGAVALGSHATKSGSRALINTSPEPVSNWVASFAEDILVVIGITLAALKPTLFLILFGILCLFAVWILPKIWRGLSAVFGRISGFRKRKGEQVVSSSAKGFDLARPGDC
ncbi:MAG: DUF4126 domain-containing protein [Alphaproteobacteria bacterium]|jgi:hypothetical protein|nr:DUF4126 domain-containing protein [Alphaproteobacteria bacterium]